MTKAQCLNEVVTLIVIVGQEKKATATKIVDACCAWIFIFVLMLRPFFPELVMSTDLLSFEHPSVLLFCFKNKHSLEIMQTAAYVCKCTRY